MMVDSVLQGTYYAWGQMFLAGVWADLDKAIREGGDFCYAVFSLSGCRPYDRGCLSEMA